jgi:hypothetical protein
MFAGAYTESDGPTKAGGGGVTKKFIVSINGLSHVPVMAIESVFKAPIKVHNPGVNESLRLRLNAL